MIDDELVRDKSRASGIIKEIVIAHEHLTDNYLKSVEQVNLKDDELDDLRTRCIELEHTLNNQAIKYKCVEKELERSDTWVSMLLCLLDESRQAKNELEKRCEMVDVTKTVQSLMKSRSQATIECNVVSNSEVPSFDLQLTQGESSSKQGKPGHSITRNDESSWKIENELERLRATVEVLEHQHHKLMGEKDDMIQSLLEHNNRLDEEAERWRKAMDSANGESIHLNTIIDTKKKEVDELVVKNKDLMD